MALGQPLAAPQILGQYDAKVIMQQSSGDLRGCSVLINT